MSTLFAIQNDGEEEEEESFLQGTANVIVDSLTHHFV
jgi:hypothetical protein